MTLRCCPFWVLAVLISTASVTAEPLRGPFTMNDGMTFYFVNPSGEAFDLTVRWCDKGRERHPCPTMVRVFDPEENLVLRHEFAGEIAKPAPWEEFKARVPRTNELVRGVPGTGKGVYEVIVHGWGGAQIEVKTEPALEFGVFGHLQWLCGQRDQFAETYVYLPPGLKKLPMIASDRLGILVLTDESGAEKLRLDKDHVKGEVEAPGEGEHVWKLSARGGDYRLDFKGLPIILCPSIEAAKAIHASVDVMPDGAICFHKHQVAAWKLLQEYKKRPASDFAVEVKPLKDYEAALLKEPARNQLLFGLYGVMALLPPILAEQCLDPKSPWFGAIRTWKDEKGRPRAENPLADYNRLDCWGLASLTKDLAALYWLKADFNPYYHNPQLLNRIIVGVLLDQIVMREGEYVYPDNAYYYGVHAFAMCHEHSGAFSLVYKDVPPEVQKLWRAGQQRLTDRFLYGQVGSTNNQWTILLAALWRYYEGTGDPWYRETVLRSARWITTGALWGTGQRPAGYMCEALGPDATYNGITGHNLAYLYHQAREAEARNQVSSRNLVSSDELREALQRCYYLFNHTIAQEPDGTWLGSSGFCHRTPGDWTGPQYGAGLGPMSSELPEAGVRFPDHGPWAWARPVFDEASRAEAVEKLRKMMHYCPEDFFDREKPNYGRAIGAFDICFANWRTWSDKFLPGRLPCMEEKPFTRNFGNEFFCVKRAGYYAFLFAGVDYQTWQSGTRPKEYNHQFPSNDGLCLFWSPGFGVSLLSKNWGAGQTNTLLADLGGGRVEWPWYWDTKSEFDTEHATVKLSGKIHDAPLSYQRAYRFLEDRVECELTVTSEKEFTLGDLSECIPYPLPPAKPGGMDVKLTPGGDGVKAICFTNAGGQGHSISLDQPMPVRTAKNHSTDHYGGEHDWGQALIALPKVWTAGQTFTLKYSLSPELRKE